MNMLVYPAGADKERAAHHALSIVAIVILIKKGGTLLLSWWCQMMRMEDDQVWAHSTNKQNTEKRGDDREGIKKTEDGIW